MYIHDDSGDEGGEDGGEEQLVGYVDEWIRVRARTARNQRSLRTV